MLFLLMHESNGVLTLHHIDLLIYFFTLLKYEILCVVEARFQSLKNLDHKLLELVVIPIIHSLPITNGIFFDQSKMSTKVVDKISKQKVAVNISLNKLW